MSFEILVALSSGLYLRQRPPPRAIGSTPQSDAGEDRDIGAVRGA